MKKLLFLMAALVVVAFALPALAQNAIVNSNDINNNGAAVGNSQGEAITNAGQFAGAQWGDNYTGGGINGSTVNVNGNGSWNNIDNSGGAGTAVNKSNIGLFGNGSLNTLDVSGGPNTLLNGSTVYVSGVGNFNAINNQAYKFDITATNSLNDNNFYQGPMTSAWQYQYYATHQYEHTIFFDKTFQGATDVVAFMPINPVHLAQSNTGINAGENAGAATATTNAAFNASNSKITGMFGANMNMGGIAQNQGGLNVVTAFSTQ